MIFGIRDVRQELGRFSGENCEACTEGYIYRLVRVTRFFVIFFINLIPLKVRFETVCDGCKAAADKDYPEAKSIAKKEFGRRNAALDISTVLKICAFVLVVAAAIALPLMLVKPALLGPQAVKDMVTEDGIFTVQDASGHVMGIVEQAEGKKTLTFYEKTSRLSGEPGADGSFIRREYYVESESGTLNIDGVTLERSTDNPGVLEDRYGTAVRVYHYDAASQSLGFAKGINDLTSISYKSDRVDYPFIFYTADAGAKEVATVLLLEPDTQIEATYVPADDGTDQLAVLVIRQLERGRISSVSSYSLSGSDVAAAIQQGINRSSSAEDIRAFIGKSGLAASNILTYHYFENTKVYTSVELSMPDESGVMQTITQPFVVEKKGGYYLQKIQATE